MQSQVTKFFTGKTGRFLTLVLRMNKLAFMVFASQNRRGPAGEASGNLRQAFDRALSTKK